jgi:hypothetical protein
VNRPIGGEPKPLSTRSLSPDLQVQAQEPLDLQGLQRPSGARAAAVSSPRPTLPPTPRRITVTIPSKLYHVLLERSDREGRSLSNLVAFLLETALSKSARPPL